MAIYLKYRKHRREILNGLKNRLFKPKSVEYIANYRRQICEKCCHYVFDDTHCVVPGSAPCCQLCGCSIELKVYSLSTSCPREKWKNIITPEAEVKIISYELMEMQNDN